jgi:hypothetical protein
MDEEQKEVLAYLDWFYSNADFGPSHFDIVSQMQGQYERETGQQVPSGYRLDVE